MKATRRCCSGKAYIDRASSLRVKRYEKQGLRNVPTSGRSWLLSNPAWPFGSCQVKSVMGFTWPEVYKKATTSKQAGEVIGDLDI